MEPYKERFIELALQKGVLKVADAATRNDWTLKSKRQSPWFFNMGGFNDGASLRQIAESYADVIQASGLDVDTLYGIPEKGTPLMAAVAVVLAERGSNLPWFFTRKDEKTYGEASNLGPSDFAKKMVVGRIPQSSQRIGQLDDVFTAGDAKYQARATLQRIGEFEYPWLAIAVNRQEVQTDGKDAVEEYMRTTGTAVLSVINALDVLDYFGQHGEIQTPERTITSADVARVATYLKVYGTSEARKGVVDRFGSLEHRIITPERSVIPACDVETLEKFEEIVRETADNPKIGGYKIGFELGLGYGLAAVVDTARKHTDKPLIYDHQKAATDIPDTGKNFARVCKKAGVDAVIFFPQAGPETERAWIYHALDQGLKVIVGGRMTHSAYAVSEGGFITDEGAEEMYRIAARAGVTNFVVPGNKPEVIAHIKGLIENEGVTPIFYSPGFVAQGGDITKAAEVAGDSWHAIAGRAIYNAADIRAAAGQLTSKI